MCIATLERFPRPGVRMSTPFPFKTRGKACECGTSLSLRIDQPLCNCCSHDPSPLESFTKKKRQELHVGVYHASVVVVVVVVVMVSAVVVLLFIISFLRSPPLTSLDVKSMRILIFLIITRNYPTRAWRAPKPSDRNRKYPVRRDNL